MLSVVSGGRENRTPNDSLQDYSDPNFTSPPMSPFRAKWSGGESNPRASAGPSSGIQRGRSGSAPEGLVERLAWILTYRTTGRQAPGRGF